MARIIKCLPCRKGCMGYASFTFRDPPGAMTATNRATSQNRMMRAPALFVAGLLLLLALILGIQLCRQYRDDIAAGQATARALTATLAEHAGRSLEETGRAHVSNPVNHSHLFSRPLLY